ncbi:helix-turn-helix domain-containing protein [Methylibium sp.]|uniref:helix-turn-helix domain-containing protein n=1 Tax=Methylibium sp. TaxID=2067992 RepID=UPI003D13F152
MRTLADIRKERNQRLQDVQAATGVDLTTVSRIERGQMPRSAGRANALARFYGLELASFYAAVAAGGQPAPASAEVA